jgi:D-alanyl-lipoteichoic acid acyltransferase DltB (MBOAT superfamily)
MGYIIDVYRDKQKVEKNFFKLALFVSFFPAGSGSHQPLRRHEQNAV